MNYIPPFHKTTTNYIIKKDDVGKAKETTYDLPHDEFRYGMPPPKINESVKDLKTKIPERDFTKLNKLSVKLGAHSTKVLIILIFKDFKDVRSVNDIPSKIVKGKAGITYNLPPQEFTYGKKNRPSSPIKYVLGFIIFVKK